MYEKRGEERSLETRAREREVGAEARFGERRSTTSLRISTNSNERTSVEVQESRGMLLHRPAPLSREVWQGGVPPAGSDADREAKMGKRKGEQPAKTIRG